MPNATLSGTNGKMLDLLTGPSGGDVYSTLGANDDAGNQVLTAWQRVMRHAAREKADALIDAGGLIAGVSNRDAADYILGLLDAKR